MREKGVSNACPQCRGKMSDADDTFYESTRLYTKAKRNGVCGGLERYQLCVEKLQHVIEIDPKHHLAQFNLGVMYENGEGVAQDGIGTVP
jgi:TPR repeat protein